MKGERELGKWRGESDMGEGNEPMNYKLHDEEKTKIFFASKLRGISYWYKTKTKNCQLESSSGIMLKLTSKSGNSNGSKRNAR